MLVRRRETRIAVHSEGAIVLSLLTFRYYSLNAEALRAWSLLEEHGDPREVAEILHEGAGAGEAGTIGDICDFADSLLRERLWAPQEVGGILQVVLEWWRKTANVFQVRRATGNRSCSST